MTGGIGGQKQRVRGKPTELRKKTIKEEYITEKERDKHNHRPLLLLFVNGEKKRMQSFDTLSQKYAYRIIQTVSFEKCG